MHRSHSQLNSWLRCGEAYRLERLDNAPRRPAAWLNQCSAFHLAIEQHERSLRGTTEAEAINTAVQEYDRLVQESLDLGHPMDTWLTGGRTKPVDDIARRRERTAEQVSAYINWAPTEPFKLWELPDGSPAVEVPFQLDLDGLTVRGMIDQVVEYEDGTVLVRDLKTGSRLPDNTLQLATYDLALYSLFGFRPGLGDYYMAKNTAPTSTKNLRSWTPATVSRMYNKVDQAITAQVFVPNVNGDCLNMCAVRDFCSAIGSKPEAYPPRPLQTESF